MSDQTYKIRDQLANGKWGPERKVTLAQYRAELDEQRAAAAPIMAAFKRGDIAGVETAQAAFRRRLGARAS